MVPGPWDGELSQDRPFYVATSQLSWQRWHRAPATNDSVQSGSPRGSGLLCVCGVGEADQIGELTLEVNRSLTTDEMQNGSLRILVASSRISSSLRASRSVFTFET